jgi:hypothetical protein
MATDFDRWLAPTGAWLTTLALALYALNRLLMRGLFRLHIRGASKLPETGAFVITPTTSAILTGWRSPRRCRGRSSDVFIGLATWCGLII